MLEHHAAQLAAGQGFFGNDPQSFTPSSAFLNRVEELTAQKYALDAYNRKRA